MGAMGEGRFQEEEVRLIKQQVTNIVVEFIVTIK